MDGRKRNEICATSPKTIQTFSIRSKWNSIEKFRRQRNKSRNNLGWDEEWKRKSNELDKNKYSPDQREHGIAHSSNGVNF